MKIRVGRTYVSYLLQVAINVGFDWVKYESRGYVRLSVIPDSELIRNKRGSLRSNVANGLLKS